MEIELTGENRLLTVRIDGELDHHSTMQLRGEIDRALHRTGAINIAFDMSQMTFMDSSGIGLIMGRYKIIRSLGGKVVIFGMNRETERILKMSGIDRIAEVY